MRRLLASLAGRAMALYVRLVAATCRPVGPAPTRDRVVLAFWHEYNLAAAVVAYRLRRHRRHVSFSTRTLRGAVMDTMLASLGAESVPLPAPGERAAAAALSRTMARLGREGATLVVNPDGPMGPYRRAKPGAVIVAGESGLPVQAWAIVARPSLRLTRRWDRHVVPLPFCRIRVEQAVPMAVERGAPLRPRLADLQAALDEVTRRADARAAPG